jgi:hypothetical protein
MRLYLTFVLLIWVMNGTFAQKNNSCNTQHEHFLVALGQSNMAVLKNTTHSLLNYGHSNALLENQVAFLHAIESKAAVYTSVKSTGRSLNQVEKTCTIRENLQVELLLNSSQKVNLNLKTLHVYVREKRKWKLLERQAVRIQ